MQIVKRNCNIIRQKTVQWLNKICCKSHETIEEKKVFYAQNVYDITVFQT